MKQVNFKELPVELMIGEEPRILDVRKELGNRIHQDTADIGVSDFGKAIYYSEGEIEIPHQYADELCRIISESAFRAPIKIALLDQIRQATTATEETETVK